MDLRLPWTLFLLFLVGFTGPTLLAAIWTVFLVGSLFNPWMWGQELLRSVALTLPGVALYVFFCKYLVGPSLSGLLRGELPPRPRFLYVTLCALLTGVGAYEWLIHQDSARILPGGLSPLCMPFTLYAVLRPKPAPSEA
jgi:hypothetical protein